MSRLDFCQYELVDDCYDWKNDHCDGCNIFKAYCEGARMAKASIVRCKDCRFNKHPSNDLCLIKKAGIYPDDDDFCSYGEKEKK